MRKPLPLPKEKFGMLTPIALFQQGDDKRVRILCVCDCGDVHDYRRQNLYGKHAVSCGCQRPLFSSLNNRSHGARSRRDGAWPEYTSWIQMRERCVKPSNKSYFRYGGRGISVCARWMTSFENFISDMGRKPSPAHSIDRINNDGNYEPGNCRWATPTEQANNRRRPHR